MALSTYTTVMVRFEKGGKQYAYKTHITDFKVGDEAVVEVKGVTKIVVVSQVHKAPRLDADAPYQYKWIICKVDRSVYNRLTAPALRDYDADIELNSRTNYTTREYDEEVEFDPRHDLYD